MAPIHALLSYRTTSSPCTQCCQPVSCAYSLLAWVEDVWEEKEQRVDDHGPKVLKEEHGGVVDLRKMHDGRHKYILWRVSELCSSGN